MKAVSLQSPVVTFFLKSAKSQSDSAAEILLLHVIEDMKTAQIYEVKIERKRQNIIKSNWLNHVRLQNAPSSAKMWEITEETLEVAEITDKNWRDEAQIQMDKGEAL